MEGDGRREEVSEEIEWEAGERKEGKKLTGSKEEGKSCTFKMRVEIRVRGK